MSKTITLRVNDDVYQMIKTAADGQRRNLSNFIEFATLQYLTSATYVDDAEMELILNDAELVANLRQGLEDIKKSDYTVV
ncbi:CopG family transcriptional regulator [Candidatus Leptofilum sp.]|uniref:CopG family transcriptional regulator n=1 Tax=Candidatus Leptofilum sp. TaxID=3241576 RepID=UPI003B5B80C7